MANITPSSTYGGRRQRSRDWDVYSASKPSSGGVAGSWGYSSITAVDPPRAGVTKTAYGSWKNLGQWSTDPLLYHWRRTQYFYRYFFSMKINVSSYLSSIGKTISDVKNIKLHFNVTEVASPSDGKVTLYEKSSSSVGDDAHYDVGKTVSSATTGEKVVDVTSYGAVTNGFILIGTDGYPSANENFVIDPASVYFEVALNNQVFINVNGTWKSGTPYINVNGVWKEGAGYYNANGMWKEGSA